MILCDDNYGLDAHMAWTRCIIRNPSEGGQPSSIYIFIFTVVLTVSSTN